MRIVTLVENSCERADLAPEFGLSLLILADGSTFLFDTGSSDRFAKNAVLLGYDLAQVSSVVLSHGHFDHGGGLPLFLDLNDKAKVYLTRTAGGAYYANVCARLPLAVSTLVHPFIAFNPFLTRYIGLDQRLFSMYAHRLETVEGLVRVAGNVFAQTNIQRQSAAPEGNKYLLEKKAGRMKPDAFDHELILIIREDDGLVLFSGCGHNGILNMVRSVKTSFPGVPIKAVVGGFHLALQPGRPMHAGSREEIISLGEALMREGIEKIYTGHCTGEGAYRILRQVLADRIRPLSTGLIFDV